MAEADESGAPRIRRALISVYDKTGLVEFARALVDEFGIEIISTGGTAKALQEAGIPVTLVEQVTGFPELMDGRVKTLHPRIHAAILADRDNPEHMRQLAEQGIAPVDMVVVNLYPFEQTIARPDCTFEQAIEMIDIGGPCLLRAAAKNHRHVLVISDLWDLKFFISQMRKPTVTDDDALRDWRRERAFYALWMTARYDAQISKWLGENSGRYRLRAETLRLVSDLPPLRYGENPHQSGDVLEYDDPRPVAGVTKARSFSIAQLSNTLMPDGAGSLGARDALPLSYNNFVDASAALELCAELTRACPRQVACCFIKHTNCCGARIGPDPIDVYAKAYLGDPNAAMGGILAVNFSVDVGFAEAVMETYARWGKPLKDAGAPHAPGGFFVEVWLAPGFDDDAVDVIRTRKDWGKRVRLLAVRGMSVAPDPDELDYKRIAGGMLVQTRDLVGLNEDQWKVVTVRKPDEREMDDLRLAWLICKHTKSNAITICRDGMLIGNGAGQMSRVMSCRIATWLARENGHADKLVGAVAASDAFFPFRDGPDILMEAGVTALIQPGGSKRDADTIQACNERSVAMTFTGTRHFRH
ncbi:MAG: bifunctional phosphoribosylaminoimidazolecarboxamide formyltransferase/inosine monophosphate cyclohydrolase [Planctomycetota bacterium]